MLFKCFICDQIEDLPFIPVDMPEPMDYVCHECLYFYKNAKEAEHASFNRKRSELSDKQRISDIHQNRRNITNSRQPDGNMGDAVWEPKC